MAQHLIPHLCVGDSKAAIEWYTKAFGAQEIMRMPAPDGRIMHAAMDIFGDRFYFNDDFPDMDPEKRSHTPESFGGSPVTIHIEVPQETDVDAFFQKAVDAGARTRMPLADMFWGARYGQVVDPFGHTWSVAKTTKQMTPDEMRKSSEDAMQKMQQRKDPAR